MAVFNIIPNTFTNIDIRDTLNANGGATGDFSGDYFSERARVNPLAKYKPVRLNSLWGREDAGAFRFENTTSIQYVSYKDYWWKSLNGLCGLNMKNVNIITGGNNDEVWTLELPRGGDEPYRSSDFAGYSPNASFGGIRLDIPSYVFSGNSFGIGVNHISPSMNALKYSDIFDKSIVGANEDTGMYIGVYSTASSSFYSEKKINLDSDSYINFSMSEIGNPPSGTNIRVHLYGKTFRGDRVSARYSNSAVTFYEIPIRTLEKFKLLVQCEVVLWDKTNNPNYYSIRNLSCDLNAYGATGGSIGQSHIYMQTLIGDYWYNQWEWTLPPSIVSSDNILRLNPWGNPFEVYVGANEFSQVRFEWNVPGYSPIYLYKNVQEY